MFYVVWFSHFYDFNKTQMAVLALAVGLVIAAELLNTAVEAVVDLVSPERNALAGLAKDIAAGGVFVSALTAVVVGLILFFDLDKLKEILDFYLNNPFHIILLAVSAIIWMLIIFLPVLLKKKG